MDRLLLANALRAAAKVLADDHAAAEEEDASRPAPPKSQTSLKAVPRARKLVAPAGKADELAARRAKQVLREHGMLEMIDEDEQ